MATQNEFTLLYQQEQGEVKEDNAAVKKVQGLDNCSGSKWKHKRQSATGTFKFKMADKWFLEQPKAADS